MRLAGPRPLPRAVPGADPRQLPRPGRLRHGAVLQRRVDDRRGAEHPRHLRPARHEPGRGAAPLPRGEPARVRRPQPLRRRLRLREGPAQAAAVHAVRPPAGLPDQPRPRADQPGGARRPVRQPAAAARRRTSHARQPDEGTNTNHFVVSDQWGDVVSYTNTIEELGGSGIVVPGRGFLLNNELTDFDFTPLQAGVPDPNLPAPGKRPRSSMSPTIVLKHGRPYPRGRLARRRVDHHHRAADPGQPGRPRHDAARGDRGAARVAAQLRHRPRPSRSSSTAADNPGAGGARPVVRDQRHVAAGPDDQDPADDRRRIRAGVPRPRCRCWPPVNRYAAAAAPRGSFTRCAEPFLRAR